MNLRHELATPTPLDTRLRETQEAFDSVAADYDGPRGNNELIQRMRQTLWSTVREELPAGSRLLDLGCGTGIDAVEFARSRFRVTASDWSPRMVERARQRAQEAGVADRLEAVHVGVQELERIEGEFDGIYSNFGPLNCAPDLAAVAGQCARLLRPGGTLVFSVMGRICPWEVGHYAVRGRFRRAAVRGARGVTPVGMNRHTIWTYYYMPREFYAAFAKDFALSRYSALSLFLPPPYMVERVRRRPAFYERLGKLDDRLGGLPLLRDMGDHFLIVMHRR
ncbi:class I SAM-dependent methyltransferase [Bacillus sp. NP157]|nr:class I SAM-dependent methyltransferase [Bacillus sp. NP157]